MTEFEKVLDLVRNLHDSKSVDYGTKVEPFQNIIDGANFAGIEPWVAAMVRANDKVGRLSISARGHVQKHDSVLDDLLDLATYAMIAYCLINRTPIGFSPVYAEWPVPVSDD